MIKVIAKIVTKLVKGGRKRLTKDFLESEFTCKCHRLMCDAKPMDKTFMIMLQDLRESWGKPLGVVSGTRCRFHNDLIGGAEHSMHLQGRASDFWIINKDERYDFSRLAIKLGFRGIGIGRTSGKIHIDNRDTLSSWFYD